MIEHIPQRLARILTPMLEDSNVMEDRQLSKIDGWTTRPEQPVPDGVCMTGEGIELPCCYVLQGLKENRKGVRECLLDSSSIKNIVRN